MKEKNKKRIVFIILFAIICMAMLAVLISDYSSVSKTPSFVVEQYLKAVQSDDTKTIEKYYCGNSFDEELEKEENTIGDAVGDKLRKFEFEVLGETIEGDKATVQVKLTTYKIGAAVVTALFDMSQSLEDSEGKTYEECLQEEMDKCDFGFEKTVNIELSMIDNKWMIDEFAEQGEFMDALAGGLYSYLAQISSLLNIQ